MKLSSYTDPLISPSFHWITFLTLSDIICSRSDLVQLYRLTNLGVLTIDHGVMCPDVGLDDSIVRSWSRAATESNSFSMLRVLNCRSQQNISSRLFEYLNSFPSLSIFNVEDCSIGYKDQLSSLKVGWQYVVGKKLKEFLSAHGSDEGNYSWNSVGRSFFKGGGTYSAKKLTAEGVEAINSLPVLQFSLGAAPPDASLEIIVHKGMRSFQRMQHSIATSTSCIKRSIEVYDQLNAEPRKKPRMRPSKQKYMEELFNRFGS